MRRRLCGATRPTVSLVLVVLLLTDPIWALGKKGGGSSSKPPSSSKPSSTSPKTKTQPKYPRLPTRGGTGYRGTSYGGQPNKPDPYPKGGYYPGGGTNTRKRNPGRGGGTYGENTNQQNPGAGGYPNQQYPNQGGQYPGQRLRQEGHAGGRGGGVGWHGGRVRHRTLRSGALRLPQPHGGAKLQPLHVRALRRKVLQRKVLRRKVLRRKVHRPGRLGVLREDYVYKAPPKADKRFQSYEKYMETCMRRTDLLKQEDSSSNRSSDKINLQNDQPPNKDGPKDLDTSNPQNNQSANTDGLKDPASLEFNNTAPQPVSAVGTGGADADNTAQGQSLSEKDATASPVVGRDRCGIADSTDDNMVNIAEIVCWALMDQLKSRRCMELYMVYSEKFLQKQAQQQAQAPNPNNRGDTSVRPLVLLFTTTVMLLFSNILLQ